MNPSEEDADMSPTPHEDMHDDDDDADSVTTAPAGAEPPQQQKLTGKHRAHQLRHDIRLFVSPLQEADKVMIKAAKKVFSEAKEMDPSSVICPWFKNSVMPKIQLARETPEQLGAFETFFHRAQPKVAGGQVRMCIWIGHDKDQVMLHEDPNWRMKDQKFGLHPCSVQTENISGLQWLLHSTGETD